MAVASSCTGRATAPPPPARADSTGHAHLIAGFTFQGKPLVNTGSGAPLYFAAPGAPHERLSVTRSPGPMLQLDRPLALAGSINGRPVRTDSTGTFAYLGNGNGSTAPEQYLAYNAADPGSTEAVEPGALVILKSKVWPCLLPGPESITSCSGDCRTVVMTAGL